MKNKVSHKDRNLMVFILCAITSLTAQYQTHIGTIKTPLNSNVRSGEFIGTDYTTQQKTDLRNYYTSTYPNAIFLMDATYTYNCHSFAWNTTEGGVIHWIGDTGAEEDIFWTDGSYTEVDAIYKGEKVSYPSSADHSAIQTTTDELYDSKWGRMVGMRHARNYCPYTPNTGVKYYARYQRNLNNVTLSGSTNRRYAAYNDFTISNTTIQSGAKVNLVCGGTMSIQSGFNIENGAQVNITTW